MGTVLIFIILSVVATAVADDERQKRQRRPISVEVDEQPFRLWARQRQRSQLAKRPESRMYLSICCNFSSIVIGFGFVIDAQIHLIGKIALDIGVSFFQLPVDLRQQQLEVCSPQLQCGNAFNGDRISRSKAITIARNFPVYLCFVREDIFSEGI